MKQRGLLNRLGGEQNPAEAGLACHVSITDLQDCVGSDQQSLDVQIIEHGKER